MTIKEFILSRTLQQGKSAGKMETTEKLLSHSKNRDRLLEAISAPREESRVFDSIDDLKDALGIEATSL